jgi:hypothetical protein
VEELEEGERNVEEGVEEAYDFLLFGRCNP